MCCNSTPSTPAPLKVHDIDLPPNKKIITVEYNRYGNLYYLTKPMTKMDSAETYEFKEVGDPNVTVLHEHKE